MSSDAPAIAPLAAPWRQCVPLVLLLYLVTAYAFVVTVQPGYGPDEPRHFAYVRRLVEKGSLPQNTGGAEADGAHALHPPLYYVLVSPVYLAARGLGDRGALIAIKAVSPLLLLGALVLFFRTLIRLFPDRPFVSLTALTIVALLPEFQLESAVMNNDALAVLLGAVWVWYLVRTWGDPPSARAALLAGLIMAVFVNTKATGWTLSPLWALTVALRAARQPGFRRAWLRDLALGYGVLLLIGTWWYARNYALYGQLVPLDFGQHGELRPFDRRTFEILSPLEVYTRGWVIHYGWRAAEGLFQSFWSQVDWIRESCREAFYGTLVALTVAAAAGGVRRLLPALSVVRRQGLAAVRLAAAPPSVLPACALLLNWAHTWYVATFMHQGFYQGGRYMMPSVYGAGLLLAAGWEALLPQRVRLPVFCLLLAALVALNALCLVELITVLNPRYVR